jgi:hypothetical protein
MRSEGAWQNIGRIGDDPSWSHVVDCRYGGSQRFLPIKPNGLASHPSIEPAIVQSRLTSTGFKNRRNTNVPTTVKDMLSAARAVVPTITPAEAADLV